MPKYMLYRGGKLIATGDHVSEIAAIAAKRTIARLPDDVDGEPSPRDLGTKRTATVDDKCQCGTYHKSHCDDWPRCVVI